MLASCDGSGSKSLQNALQKAFPHQQAEKECKQKHGRVPCSLPTSSAQKGFDGAAGKGLFRSISFVLSDVLYDVIAKPLIGGHKLQSTNELFGLLSFELMCIIVKKIENVSDGWSTTEDKSQSIVSPGKLQIAL